MTPDAFIKTCSGFNARTVAERILIAGYYLHTIAGKERFDVAAVNAWFDQGHLPRPVNTSSQMNALVGGATKRLLKDRAGLRLSAPTREWVAAMLPGDQKAAPLLQQLKALESRVMDAEQKVFLKEANVCFQNSAYRASIVMAWNLAYHHFCAYIISGHLAPFNAQLKLAYPKKSPISKHSDLEDLMESQVIEVAKGSQIISKSTSKVLTEKLNKRNSAAHPSSVVILAVTAEEVIADLVENILLRSVL